MQPDQVKKKSFHQSRRQLHFPQKRYFFRSGFRDYFSAGNLTSPTIVILAVTQKEKTIMVSKAISVIHKEPCFQH